MKMYLDMLNEKDESVQLYALRKLSENGINLEVQEFLEKNINRFSDSVKLRIIEILNNRRSEAVNQYALGNIFGQNSEKVISALLISLSLFKSDESFRIIKSFLSHENSDIRAAAVEAMYRSGFRNTTEYIFPMIKDISPIVRLNALFVLCEKTGEEFFDNIVKELDTEVESVRAHGAYVLSRILNKRKFQVLVSLLKDESPIVRKRAVKAMRAEKNPTYLKYFNEAFIRERNMEVVEEIIYAMKDIDEEKAVNVLESSSDDSGNISILRNFIWALGKLKTERSLVLLKNYLLHNEPVIRAAAIESLGEYNSRKYIDIMLPYLNDRNEDVKLSAARVLWKFGVMNAYTSLKKMITTGSDNIRKKAGIILALMGM